jgi:hypothetical protein
MVGSNSPKWMINKNVKNNRHRNAVIKGSLLLLSCLILSGCIGAGIMAVQSGYDTYKGSDATQVIVVKKKKNITAIDKVTLYVAGMGSSGTIELQKNGTLRPLIISALKSKRVARSFIEDFGSCQNRITTLADGFASDAHLRTDLPKNKPTVSFLKASTAYMALRAGKVEALRTISQWSRKAALLRTTRPRLRLSLSRSGIFISQEI